MNPTSITSSVIGSSYSRSRLSSTYFVTGEPDIPQTPPTGASNPFRGRSLARVSSSSSILSDDAATLSVSSCLTPTDVRSMTPLANFRSTTLFSRATNFNHLQIDTPLSECTLREEYESYEGEFFGSGANRILIVEESERDWFPHDECLPQSSSVLSTAPLHELDHAVNSSKSANFGFHAQTDEDDQQSLLSSEENWKDAEDAMSLLSVDEDWRDSGILGESSAVVGILEHGNTIARHCSARRKSLLRDEDGANVLLGSDELVFVELFRG